MLNTNTIKNLINNINVLDVKNVLNFKDLEEKITYIDVCNYNSFLIFLDRNFDINVNSFEFDLYNVYIKIQNYFIKKNDLIDFNEKNIFVALNNKSLNNFNLPF